MGQVEREGRPTAVVHVGDGARHVLGGRDVRTLLRDGADLGELSLGDEVTAEDMTRSLAPVLPGKIVAIGLNYLDHVREAAMEPPAQPLVFAKFPSSIIGPGTAIVIDEQVTKQVDWEVELAAVIGKRCSRVESADALGYVAGYTVANDVSARDLQFGDGQWVRGKSLDTFCPLGPVLVTPDELGDIQRLALRTRLNHRLVQDSSTSEMIFPVAQLIAYLSRHFVLEPGDVVLTGTPWGCGGFADPPVFLEPGDEIEVEVEGIGTLTNPVHAAR